MGAVFSEWQPLSRSVGHIHQAQVGGRADPFMQPSLLWKYGGDWVFLRLSAGSMWLIGHEDREQLEVHICLLMEILSLMQGLLFWKHAFLCPRPHGTVTFTTGCPSEPWRSSRDTQLVTCFLDKLISGYVTQELLLKLHWGTLFIFIWNFWLVCVRVCDGVR